MFTQKKKLRTKLTHNVKIKNQINNLSKLKWCIHLILPQQHKLYHIFVKKINKLYGIYNYSGICLQLRHKIQEKISMFPPFPSAFSSSKQKLKHNFCQLILLFSLFLLLFMSLIALFDTIYGSHCTISANFYFIYCTFNKKFLVSTK